MPDPWKSATRRSPEVTATIPFPGESHQGTENPFAVLQFSVLDLHSCVAVVKLDIRARRRLKPRAGISAGDRIFQRLLASSAPSVSPPRGATPSVAPASPALRDTTCAPSDPGAR